MSYDSGSSADRKRVGDRVRALRARLGMTQAVLAKRLGIAPARLSHYETGRRPLPVDVASDLAKLGKISLDQLYSSRRRRGALP